MLRMIPLHPSAHTRRPRFGRIVTSAFTFLVLGGLAVLVLHRSQSPSPSVQAPLYPTLAPHPAPPSPITAPASSPSAPLAPARWQEFITAGRTDPETAWTLIARLPESHDRKFAVTAVCLGIADVHPRAAMLAAWKHQVGRFTESATETIALETLAGQWASRDLPAAMEWAATLPATEDARHDQVIKGIARAALAEAPAISARIVIEAMSANSRAQRTTVVDIVRQLAARNKDDALAWLAHFPEGPALDLGIATLSKMEPAQPPTDGGVL